jgi:hypothetical protein
MDELTTGLVVGVAAGLVAGILTGVVPTMYFARQNSKSQEKIIKGQEEIINALAENNANQREIIRLQKEGVDKATVEQKLAELEHKEENTRKRIVTATLAAKYHLAPEVVEKLGLTDELTVQLTRDGKVVEERRSKPRSEE